MIVNFKQFPIYQGISKKMKVAADISESLANCIYSTVPGIRAHMLAEKIYSAEGNVEISEEEVAIIRTITAELPGMYADSINDHLKGLEEKYD